MSHLRRCFLPERRSNYSLAQLAFDRCSGVVEFLLQSSVVAKGSID